MTLVDTSVWIEFLRGTGSPAAAYVRTRIGVDLAVCEPVAMELLAGARPGAQAASIERLLAAQEQVALDAVLDHRGAVDVYWATRSTGHQPRSLIDCLVAALTLRAGVPVAHRDIDYEHIGRATGLATIDLR